MAANDGWAAYARDHDLPLEDRPREGDEDEWDDERPVWLAPDGDLVLTDVTLEEDGDGT